MSEDPGEHFSGYAPPKHVNKLEELREMVPADHSLNEHLMRAIYIYVALREVYSQFPEVEEPDSPREWGLTVANVMQDALQFDE